MMDQVFWKSFFRLQSPDVRRSVNDLGWRRLACALVAVSLTACASVTPPSLDDATWVDAGWTAPLPENNGSSATLTTPWWEQFDDPTLSRLVTWTQERNPNLTVSWARLAQARATAKAVGANASPSLNAVGGVNRSHTELPPAPGTSTTLSVGLDASWEIDLFGGLAKTRTAAQQRILGAQTQWHATRVSLAAEVADTYTQFRACEALLEIYKQDAASLAQVATLTQKRVQVGFEAPANGALTAASAAEAVNRWVAQKAECDVSLQALSVLTVEPVSSLRNLLGSRTGVLPETPSFNVPLVPAVVLNQRPDVHVAERQMNAAAAEVGAAEADRWPKLSLSGSITRLNVSSGSVDVSSNSWSLGTNLIAPLINGGRLKANAEGARGRYEEARANWQITAMNAAREVEEDLIRLDAANQRVEETQRAAEGYASFYEASEAQWKVGTGSLLDLEQARRGKLASEAALIQIQRERIRSWLALYKAIGGGWAPGDAVIEPPSKSGDAHP